MEDVESVLRHACRLIDSKFGGRVGAADGGCAGSGTANSHERLSCVTRGARVQQYCVHCITLQPFFATFTRLCLQKIARARALAASNTVFLLRRLRSMLALAAHLTRLRGIDRYCVTKAQKRLEPALEGTALRLEAAETSASAEILL